MGLSDFSKDTQCVVSRSVHSQVGSLELSPNPEDDWLDWGERLGQLLSWVGVMGLPHQLGSLAEGEQSTCLGAEVPCGLAPVLGPERYCPLLSLRVTPSGSQLWTRSHSVVLGQRGQAVRPVLKIVSAGGSLEVDVEWALELGLCLPSG